MIFWKSQIIFKTQETLGIKDIVHELGSLSIIELTLVRLAESPLSTAESNPQAQN